jgi:hypothetical protein
MTAYNPPLFSFSTLKFNSLIYEVADTVSTVASSIVHALSIITNKIFTYDTSLSRDLWCDSDLSPINIGTLNTIGNDINTGSYSNNNYIGDVSISQFRIDGRNSELHIGDNTALLYVGTNAVPGGTLVFGNPTTPFINGGFQFYQSDIRPTNTTYDSHIMGFATSNIFLGEDIDSSHGLFLGNTFCNAYLGNYVFETNTIRCFDTAININVFNDSSSLTIGDNSNYVYLAHGQLAGDLLYVGNQNNTTYIGGFQLDNQTLKALVPANPVNLFTTNTGNISFGTGLGAGKYIYIGSLTNTNQIGSLYWLGQSIYPVNTASQLSIGSTLTSSLVLGNATNTNQLGKFVHTGTSLSMAGVATTAVDLFTGTTGLISLGGTTGNILIGGINTLNQTLTGNITTDPVNLFTTTSGQITIGNTTNTNTVGRINFVGNAITSSSITTAVQLFNTQTSGNISMGTGLNSLQTLTMGNANCIVNFGNYSVLGNSMSSSSVTGAMTMLNNITTGSIQLGAGVTGLGSIQIGGTSTANIYVGLWTITAAGFNYYTNAAITLFQAITTSTVNFCNALTTGSLNIASTLTSGFVNIGGTGVTTGGLRLYNAITMGYTTLVTPTANQIGYTMTGTGTITQSTTAETTIRTITLTVGVWILNGNVFFNSSISWGSLSISGTNNTHSFVNGSIVSNPNAGNCANVTKIITVTSGTSPQYLVVNSATTYPLTNIQFTAVRIT